MKNCISCGEIFEKSMLIGGVCPNCYELINGEKSEEGKLKEKKTTLKEAALDYDNLKLETFSETIPKLKKEIEEKPDIALNYYYLAKEYMLKVPLRSINSLKEIENLLRKSLEIKPNLWAPKIFLGELLFKQGKFEEAEKYFRKVIDEQPESVSIKDYLAKCIEINFHKEDETSERDTLYLFENDLRRFIKNILEKEFGNNWWREGIPESVRVKCVSRKEQGLKEEESADLLLFADFYDYKQIIESNKKIFIPSLNNIKKWCIKLDSIESIRNPIAHNRPLPTDVSKIKDYYEELKVIIESRKC